MKGRSEASGFFFFFFQVFCLLGDCPMSDIACGVSIVPSSLVFVRSLHLLQAAGPEARVKPYANYVISTAQGSVPDGFPSLPAPPGGLAFGDWCVHGKISEMC